MLSDLQDSNSRKGYLPRHQPIFCILRCYRIKWLVQASLDFLPQSRRGVARTVKSKAVRLRLVRIVGRRSQDGWRCSRRCCSGRSFFLMFREEESGRGSRLAFAVDGRRCRGWGEWDALCAGKSGRKRGCQIYVFPFSAYATDKPGNRMDCINKQSILFSLQIMYAYS